MANGSQDQEDVWVSHGAVAALTNAVAHASACASREEVTQAQYDSAASRFMIASRALKNLVKTKAAAERAADDAAEVAGRTSRLVVTATDVTNGELLYLPWDYERLGLDPDEQRVADAVAASIAIPFFFEPVELEDGNVMMRPNCGMRMASIPRARTPAVEPTAQPMPPVDQKPPW